MALALNLVLLILELKLASAVISIVTALASFPTPMQLGDGIATMNVGIMATRDISFRLITTSLRPIFHSTLDLLMRGDTIAFLLLFLLHRLVNCILTLHLKHLFQIVQVTTILHTSC